MHCARTLMGVPHSDLHAPDLYHHSLFNIGTNDPFTASCVALYPVASFLTFGTETHLKSGSP